MPVSMAERSNPAFDLLAGLTARLASTASLEEITKVVSNEIAALGFGAVWIAVLDEASGNLISIREVIDGRDTTHEMPRIFMLDMRQPIGHGFRERRMINIADPDSLLIIEDTPGPIPEGRMALPRVVYDHLRGHPFACGPLLGSRGQPVGALGLSSYLGRRPIPDPLFEQGLLRAFMDHLGIAMERALHVQKLERLNAELVRAHDLLLRESRMRAVGELAAAVAHDLNNLSGIVLMAVSVARRSQEGVHEALRRIEKTSRAIGDLARRLQRVAHTGADAQVQAVDLRLIVEDVVLMMAPLCREESIRLQSDLGSRANVIAEPTLLRQVVLNLVWNAREALSEVTPERRLLEIAIARVRENGLVLTVRDHGPGLPADMLEQCFDAFATTKGAGHAGLGLAIVQSAMKHFGGGVNVYNTQDGGACFELRFKTAPVRGIAQERPLPTTRVARFRLLVIDDDPDVLDVMRTFLGLSGHDVLTEVEGHVGLERARHERFDMILCDVGMPGLSGLDLVRELRDAGVGAKLVLMTGWDSQQVAADPRAAMCDALLQKPFVGDDIGRLLSKLISFQQ